MTTKKRSVQCVECGSSMVYEVRKDSVSYKGQSRDFEVAAWWCTSCDEAILDGDALKKSEAVFQSLKAAVDGVLGPTEIAAVRKKLGLSQARASELLGGGPRAFQKYESGKTAVSVAMSNLLRLLDRDPLRLRELEPKQAVPGAKRAEASATKASATSKAAQSARPKVHGSRNSSARGKPSRPKANRASSA